MDNSAIEGKTTNNSTEVVKTAIPAVLVEKEGSSEDAGNKAKLDKSNELVENYFKEIMADDHFEDFMPNDQVGQDLINFYIGLELGLINNVDVDQGKELDAAPENEPKKEQEENVKENIDVANRIEDVHERRSSTDENDNAALENEAKKEHEENEKENIDVANRTEDVHERGSSTDENDNQSRVVSISKQRRPKRKHVEMKRLETRLKGTEPSRPKRRRG